MAMFQSKDEKTDELMKKYGLQSMKDETDRNSVKSIVTEMAGSGLMSFGTLLSGKGEEAIKINLMKAIIEQNWIIIRQLDKLNNK